MNHSLSLHHLGILGLSLKFHFHVFVLHMTLPSHSSHNLDAFKSLVNGVQELCHISCEN
jgi:hypothetical protein